jgi:hypothetical protein
MLALFLNHPPLFVAGEVALGLSLALFVGALVTAIRNRATEMSQLRDAGYPNPMNVRRSVGEAVRGHPNARRPALATIPAVRSSPRSALRQRGA